MCHYWVKCSLLVASTITVNDVQVCVQKFAVEMFGWDETGEWMSLRVILFGMVGVMKDLT